MQELLEEVLVFKRDLLPDLPTDAFIHDTDLLSDLIRIATFIDRATAEHDPSYKQLIPYSIIRNEGSVFQYKRSAWGQEPRLHGLYSIGVGGHVNRSDILPLFTDVKSIIEWARERELTEEFNVKHLGQPRLIGLINDESDQVGRVHFGIAYEYCLDEPKVEPREKRNHIQYDFIPIEEAVTHKERYESWSRIVIEQYLSNIIPSGFE